MLWRKGLTQYSPLYGPTASASFIQVVTAQAALVLVDVLFLQPVERPGLLNLSQEHNLEVLYSMKPHGFIQGGTVATYSSLSLVLSPAELEGAGCFTHITLAI